MDLYRLSEESRKFLEKEEYLSEESFICEAMDYILDGKSVTEAARLTGTDSYILDEVAMIEGH